MVENKTPGRWSSSPRPRHGSGNYTNELEAFLKPDAEDPGRALIASVIEGVAEAVSADGVLLFLVDHSADELLRWEPSGEDGEVRMPMDEGICGQVLRSGRAVHLEDVRIDPELNALDDIGTHVRGLLAVPVRDAEGGIIAVLQFTNCTVSDEPGREPGPFSAAHVRVALALAPCIGSHVGQFLSGSLRRARKKKRPSDVLRRSLSNTPRQGTPLFGRSRRTSSEVTIQRFATVEGRTGEVRSLGARRSSAPDVYSTHMSTGHAHHSNRRPMNGLEEEDEQPRTPSDEMDAERDPARPIGLSKGDSLPPPRRDAHWLWTQLQRLLCAGAPRIVSLQYEEPLTYRAKRLLRDPDEMRRLRQERYVLLAVLILTGLLCGCVVYVCHLASSMLLKAKYDFVEAVSRSQGLTVAAVPYVLMSVAILVGAAVIVEIAPFAAGSGMSNVLLLLNGTFLPQSMDLKTLAAKMAGLVLVASAGIAAGSEGPMIHMGTIIGCLVANLAAPSVLRRTATLHGAARLRMDLAASGAGAALSGAFLAPMSGVLLVLEELGTYWSKPLLVRVFVCCLSGAAVAMLLWAEEQNLLGRLFLDRVHAVSVLEPEDSYTSQGVFVGEVVAFAFMGVLGGVGGSAFNAAAMRVSAMRRKHVSGRRWRRVADAAALAGVSAVAIYSVCAAWPCSPFDKNAEPRVVSKYAKGLGCADPYKEWNPMATLWLNPLLKADAILLSHEHVHFSLSVLAAHWALFLVLALAVVGTTVPHGLLLVSITLGGGFGRALGVAAELATGVRLVHGLWATVGASAFVAGATHTTLAFMMMLVELTDDSTYLVPATIAAVIAHTIGSSMGKSYYDRQVEATHMAFLEQADEDQPALNLLDARDVMTKNPSCLRGTEPLRSVAIALASCGHHGFPLVDPGDNGRGRRMVGFVTRERLVDLVDRELAKLTGLPTGGPAHHPLPPAGPRDAPSMQPSAEAAAPADGSALEVDFELWRALCTIGVPLPADGPEGADGASVLRALAQRTVSLAEVSDVCPFAVREGLPIRALLHHFLRLGARNIVVLSDNYEVLGICTRSDVDVHALDRALERSWKRPAWLDERRHARTARKVLRRAGSIRAFNASGGVAKFMREHGGLGTHGRGAEAGNGVAGASPPGGGLATVAPAVHARVSPNQSQQAETR